MAFGRVLRRHPTVGTALATCDWPLCLPIPRFIEIKQHRAFAGPRAIIASFELGNLWRLGEFARCRRTHELDEVRRLVWKKPSLTLRPG